MTGTQAGISPKVLLPVLANLAIGIALLALGERELGIGLLLAVATNAGLGYVARPGAINPDLQPTLPYPPMDIDTLDE